MFIFCIFKLLKETPQYFKLLEETPL